MNSILVTGGGGFIGRRTIGPLLERGFTVHLATRDSQRMAEISADVQVHAVNLLDATAAAALVAKVRPSHLLHLAWYTEHGLFWHSSENLSWLAAGANLLRDFVEAGGRRVVCAGTCAEYDWSDGHCDELQTPCRPTSLYGVTKNALHQVAQTYLRAQGVSLAWGRIFFLYGPGEDEKRFYPSVVRRLSAGHSVVCNSRNNVRDFLHVDDAGDAFAALAACDIEGPVNIASGRPVKLGDFAEAAANQVGRPDLLTLEDRPPTADNPRRITAAVERLRNEVGWSPRHPELLLDLGSLVASGRNFAG